MTNDEKVALVEKAKEIVEEEISVIKTFDLLTKINTAGSGFIQVQSKQLNSWLANQDTFKRHEDIRGKCIYCSPWREYEGAVDFPCPELVTTADLLVNGVKE